MAKDTDRQIEDNLKNPELRNCLKKQGAWSNKVKKGIKGLRHTTFWNT